MIRTYRSKDQRRKATEKEMLLWVARKDDLQLVLRLEQGMRGVEETQDRAARSSQSCPLQPELQACCMLPPGTQPGWPDSRLSGYSREGPWGLADDPLVSVGCHRSLPFL